jgi:hypothetical protein
MRRTIRPFSNKSLSPDVEVVNFALDGEPKILHTELQAIAAILDGITKDAQTVVRTC